MIRRHTKRAAAPHQFIEIEEHLARTWPLKEEFNLSSQEVTQPNKQAQTWQTHNRLTPTGPDPIAGQKEEWKKKIPFLGNLEHQPVQALRLPGQAIDLEKEPIIPIHNTPLRSLLLHFFSIC